MIRYVVVAKIPPGRANNDKSTIIINIINYIIIIFVSLTFYRR
jgi:hypothetical protein